MSVTAPLGFRAAAVAAGIKATGSDLALLVADSGCAAAGVFTTNRAQAAPVLVSRAHLSDGLARAIVVNAGCANAGTGERGLADAREMAEITARALGCRGSEVVVASTGVIGVPLPMAKVREGIETAAARLSREGGADAAQAILTTDTHPKQALVELPLDGHTARIGAMAKGAGMIAPNMATLLAFFTTDAGLEPRLLQRALREAVGESLNRITVDGDTSTNDMAVILASGALPARAILDEGPDYDAFRAALTEAARRIAAMIVRDGEGATRVAEVRVEGARVASEAGRIAAGQDRAPRRRPELGPDPGGRGPLRRRGGHGPGGRLPGRCLGGRGGPRPRVRRGPRPRGRPRGPGPHPRAAPLGRRHGLDLDLRLLPRLRGHQRELSLVKLWGGNYSGDPDRAFWDFNRSFPFDRRLLPEEIAASRAFVGALERCGALSRHEAASLDAGLAQVLAKAEADPAYLESDAEDVHSFVEARLTEAVGDVAGQSHLGRSRNEQAVTALRLWVRSAIDRLLAAGTALVEALAEKGREGNDMTMPGFTHTRAAEPITFGHLAAAHAWALVRDHDRLRDARRRVDVLPLGSGALAGSPLPLDREALARDLGFAAVSQNALDAVSDRDFAVEFVACCAILQTHLSRLATDLIAFSGPEWGFVTLPEAFTTGSSLMPQKKNPDALELMRGKAGRVDGHLGALLTLLKGLPTGYQKDLQEDKEAVFDAGDTAAASLAIATGVVAGLGLDRGAMRRAAERGDMMAAALAVALARDGMPFRKAHALVGALVAEAAREGTPLREAASRSLAAQSKDVAAWLAPILDPDEAVRSRTLVGGTAPTAVLASLASALERVKGACR